jgi:hypothetical protein
MKTANSIAKKEKSTTPLSLDTKNTDYNVKASKT